MARRAVIYDTEVGGGFSGRMLGGTIVTRNAAWQIATMIKSHIRPNGWLVAILARRASWKMPAWLARGFRAVVAIRAIVNNARMVKHANVPGIRHMAALAVVAGLDVAERLAAGALAVMAGCTGQCRLLVVKARNRPGRRHMAVFANLGGFYMGFGPAGCRLAIVATEAFIGDSSVVNAHHFPVPAIVAVGTIRAAWRMLCRFTIRHAAIVAADTSGGHTLENATFMAGFAGDTRVGTNQGKPGKLVVEGLINLGNRIDRFRGSRQARERKRRENYHGHLQQLYQPASFQFRNKLRKQPVPS